MHPMLYERPHILLNDHRGSFVAVDFGETQVSIDHEDFYRLRYERWFIFRPSKRPGLSYVMANRNRLMHRVIMNASKGKLVDHEDGNGRNNRRYNLRECTHAQNLSNQHNRVRPSATGYRGVYETKEGRFSAIISVANRKRYIGTFDTASAAAHAWDAAARELRGEFTQTNFEA